MENIFFEDNVKGIAQKDYRGYQVYVFCHEGEITFTYNDQKFQMRPSSCAIILNNKFLKDVKCSDDLRCGVLFIKESVIRQSGPNNPYAVQAMLSLYSNPVMDLNEKERELCLALFRNFRRRIEEKDHKFYDEILRTSAHMLLLDLFDFHARINRSDNLSVSSANIMQKFITMLQNKEYRQNREVAYYAEKLCVVPKYLSEVSNKVSGFSASYWINRYASQDINELLRKKEMSSAEIVKLFHFTSASYFNRYVKRSLGAYPSELRGKK